MNPKTAPTQDPRIGVILDLILQITSGNLSARGAVSERGDELDALTTGLNMLGEELSASFEALRRARAELEERVGERTAELAQTTAHLQIELAERGRTEAALQQAHAELKDRVKELERHTREMAVLTELGEMLQACAASDEAYTVIAHSARQLFPTCSGALFIFSASRNLVEAMAIWGETPLERLFAPSDCWALRGGRAHRVVDARRGPRCRHVGEFSGAYLCVPLMAQGEILGLLHVRAGPDGVSLSEAERQLAVTVAEHVALALANLKLREDVRNLSIRDPLTGLFNRRYLEETLSREISRAARGQRPLGVLMLDLDHFKHFNDTFGHDAGDAVLRELGGFLKAHMRASDVACRYGGEEFVLIMPEATLASAQQRAEEIRTGVSRLSVQHRGQSLGGLTLSLGVSAFPEHGQDGETLVRVADAALYQAKQAGRNRVLVAGAGG